LKQKAQWVAMLSTQPIYILREVLQYLENHRIVIPGYTFLQDMVVGLSPASAGASLSCLTRH
jgi:hypothetical protein